MSPERYFHLLELVKPRIEKKDTRFRKAISADERLTLTLRYLASGAMQESLSFSYRISRASVCGIVYEVCLVLWDVLQEDYMRCPNTNDQWMRIAEQFESDWNMPHCVGAIDGKHIAMDCPRGTGSNYHCYKGYFSTVLLAVCDANYCFSLLDIGNYGSNNDAGILANSKMGKRFKAGKFNLPAPEKLNGCPLDSTPFFLVGDDIFPLCDWLMKPFSGNDLWLEELVFNYRLSRARRIIENCFGILVARWRIFHGPIRASVETVEAIIQATCVLHNYLRLTDNAFYCPAGFVDSEAGTGEIKPGDWRKLVRGGHAMQNSSNLKGRRLKHTAVDIRNALKDYVNSDTGAVEWQVRHVTSVGPVLE